MMHKYSTITKDDQKETAAECNMNSLQSGK